MAAKKARSFAMGDILRTNEGILGIVYEAVPGGILYFPVCKALKRGEKALDLDLNMVEKSAMTAYHVVGKLRFAARTPGLSAVGNAGPAVIDRMLRHVAHDVAEKHYRLVHRPAEAFIPGKSPVRYGGRVYDSQEMAALLDSGLDFWLTSGRYAAEFETDFAKYLGVRHTTLTNSGSSANLLAVSALTARELKDRRLRPGDEVLTVACAFPTTVVPIVMNRLVPVFLDVDIGTYNVQAERIEHALGKRTKAIFLAHTLGNPFDLAAVKEICERRGLWLLEDNCDALGARYGGRLTGTFGDISTFSFYPAHHMTMGEGGALATDDALLKRLIESYRDWGRDCWCGPGKDDTCRKRFKWKLGTLPEGYDHKYVYSHMGYNLKLTDMQAAVGVAQLKKLDRFIAKRAANWRYLRAGLRKYEEHLLLPEPTKGSKPSWFGFILTVKDGAPFTRNELTGFLESRKVATRLLFCGNLLRHPAFQGIKCRRPDGLRNTDRVMNDTFWIGVYPGLTRPMLDYVLGVFREFMRLKKC